VRRKASGEQAFFRLLATTETEHATVVESQDCPAGRVDR
jgi:hypothetical protein